VLLLVGFGISGSTAAHAATYYVSTSGNDTNPGSLSQPWRTIQKAADSVNPGDTVLVNDGVYTTAGSGTACGSDPAVVCVARGGTSGNWVTFKSINKWGAKLNGTTASAVVEYGFRIVNGASFVEFNGFEIYNVGTGNGGANGIMINGGGSSDFRIIGNDIHDVGRVCKESGYGMDGIFIRNPNALIDGNRIHSIGSLRYGENGCNQTLSPNHDHGIYTASTNDSVGANNITITNNLFYDITMGWPIAQGSVEGAQHTYVIANNTFAGANPDRDGQIIFTSSIKDVQITNNIFYAPRTVAIWYWQGTYSGIIVNNNMLYGASLDAYSNSSSGVANSGNINANPLFVSLGSRDFHLTSASPATNAGTSVSAVSKDFDGLARSSPPEIGAYENGPTSSATMPSPAPPANVRIVLSQ
jgi:hypothetical protein